MASENWYYIDCRSTKPVGFNDMDTIRELSMRYLKPVLSLHGFQLDNDNIFRKWALEDDICCVIESRKANDRYSVSFGFCAITIANWYGLSTLSLPNMSACKTCGIVVGIGALLNHKLQMGWPIHSTADLERVGRLFAETTSKNLENLLTRFMSYNGGITHFRQQAETQAAGRGPVWSMLGYSLLASPASTLAQITDVITSHACEDSAKKLNNRVDMHLKLQRQLVHERFGIDIADR